MTVWDGVHILPVRGLPEIHAGDDLASLIAATVELRDGDVVVVAQKIVSKAEGAVVRLDPSGAAADDDPGDETSAIPPVADAEGGDFATLARRRLARRHAARVVADTPQALIVRTRHGFVCANAGIDASNAAPGTLLLLPEDPDASAQQLLLHLRARTGKQLAVVITDTFGRPWRTGQTDVALGVAGMAAIRDERNGLDRSGRRLDVTQVALADEVAAASDLVRRKADGIPVVIVRGLEWQPTSEPSGRDLVRDEAMDLFPRGRGALAGALRAPEQLRPWDDGGLQRAISAARTVCGDWVGFAVERVEGTVVATPRADSRPQIAGSDMAVALGAAAAFVCAVLVDDGHAARLVLGAPPSVVVSAGDGSDGAPGVGPEGDPAPTRRQRGPT